MIVKETNADGTFQLFLMSFYAVIPCFKRAYVPKNPEKSNQVKLGPQKEKRQKTESENPEK